MALRYTSSGPVGLVVVHGIGDPAPGEVLRDFTDALASGRLASFEPLQEVEHLPDRVRSTGTRLEFFPAHIRTGATHEAEREIVAAEVFWGSASQLAPGKWGVLQGIASVLLNVPALITGLDERRGGVPNLLHRLVWMTSMLLGAVAFAFNTVLLIAMGLFAATALLVGAPSPGWDVLIAVAAAGLAVLLSWHPWLWFPEAQWSLRLAGPICLLGTLFTSRTLEGFAKASILLLGGVLFLTAALVFLLGVVLAIAEVTRTSTRACRTGMQVLSLQFGFWSLAAPLTWRMIFKALPTDAVPAWMQQAFGRGMTADGIVWVLALPVMAVFLVTAIVRYLHGRAEEERIRAHDVTAEEATPSGRLILHPAIGFTVCVAAMLGAVAACVCLLGRANLLPAGMQATAASMAVGLSGAAVALLPLCTTQLRLALDLAHDVIFHMYYCCDCGRRVLERRKDPSIVPANPMRERFRVVVEYLVATKHVSRLIIVAHSQGSMLAVDELAHSWVDETLPPVTLITCGSPVSQLYQHYFASVYPAWTDPSWQTLFSQPPRLARWGNFYRLDDYVGTKIAVPPDVCDFRQEAIGQGGAYQLLARSAIHSSARAMGHLHGRATGSRVGR